MHLGLAFLFSVAGFVFLWKGADWLVEGSVRLALAAKVSTIVIGVTIVAFGTSLPEMAVSLAASVKDQPEITVGNVVGSNIANVLLVLGLAAVFPMTRLSVSKWIQFLIDGGRDGLGVALACAAIGIIIGAVTTTGIGIKINQVIVALGQEQLLLALGLSAVCAILLGMGLPTAASYLMVIFVAGPAVMQLGVTLLQAHLFIFYYAVLSAITPPVALAVFAAAAIARENPVTLAGNAVRLCYIGFLLPIIWVYHPEVFLADLPLGEWPAGIAFLGALLVAITAMNASHIGYFKGDLNLPIRILLLLAGLAIIMPGALSTGTGAILSLGLFGFCWWKHRKMSV